VPTELRHADNRKFAALSGEVFLGGGRTRQRRIVHQYPARRQAPDVVAADAAIQETVRDTGRRKSLIREICFFGGRVVEHGLRVFAPARVLWIYFSNVEMMPCELR
jgi:hypothetical protein